MIASVPFRELTSPWQDFCQSVRSASPLVVVCGVLMVNAIESYRTMPIHTIHNVVIRRKLDNFHFELEYLDGFQAGKPWMQTFTTDSELTDEKGFCVGCVLDEFGFVDTGTAWDTNPDLQGYWFNRKNPDGSYARFQ